MLPKIWHCNGFRKVKPYWLVPQNKTYQYEQLLILEKCPTCHQRVLEWQGVMIGANLTDRHRVKQVDHAKWLARTQTDVVFHPEEVVAILQGMTFEPLVSDWTRMISRDVANTYHRILKRL